MPETKYIGGIFSHFEGSTEKFYYCDRVDATGARMTNVRDYTEQKQVFVSVIQRTYIQLDDDLRRRLGVSDDDVAKVAAQFKEMA